RIAHVLKGQSKPLFVPFTIATPNPEWLEHLQAGGAVEALEKIEGVSLEQILSRPDADTALVHVITSDIGTYAIITCRSVPPEMLLCKTLTRARLENLLRGWMWLYYWHREHYYYKTIERIIERRKMSKDEGEAFREAAIRIPYRCIFYNQYLFERLQPTEVPTAEGIPMVPFPSWLLMEAILRELGKGDIVSSEGLWQRVNERLFARGIRRIILCPDKALALFPHHAAILNVEIDGQKEFLLDRYEIVYLPPGAFAQSRPTTPQVQRLLVFGTDNEALLELGIASLHSLLPDRIIEWHASRVSETPRKQFADALSRLNVDALTFLGHGEYDWQNPSRSYLGILSDGKNGFNSVITLGFLRSHMPSRLRVIVLIGCETGLPQVIASSYKGFAEDLISLPSVSTVISTLWPVRDVSTLLLIRQFHRYWLLSNLPTGEEGCSPGKALRKAQRWLRMLTREEAISELEMLTSIYATKEIDKEIHILRESFVERPYAHPYFWSPFYVTGDIQ
ncbi:MAG: CHAT domain-containing protein, partial [Candidatus Methanomethylicaceae archaeon]